MPTVPTEQISIEAPIEAKIAWAENGLQETRDLLFRDEEIVEFMRRLREAIHATHIARAETGMVDECRDCEQREGGSCCGAGLEDNYDGVLLLINLLLDAKLPKQRHDPLSCLFLGPNGCLLLARHVICVNYLCMKMADRIDPTRIAALREKEGIELERLFFLHERINERLKARRS